MSGRYGRTLTVVATVGSGLMAGVFFAFSTFVMTALGRLPDRQGLRAMQEINDAAPTPWFTVPFVGIGLVWVALVVLALRRASTRQALYLLIGSGLYLVVRTLAFLGAAILFAVALVASRRSEATSTTTRPVGELDGAAELVASGVDR